MKIWCQASWQLQPMVYYACCQRMGNHSHACSNAVQHNTLLTASETRWAEPGQESKSCQTTPQSLSRALQFPEPPQGADWPKPAGVTHLCIESWNFTFNESDYMWYDDKHHSSLVCGGCRAAATHVISAGEGRRGRAAALVLCERLFTAIRRQTLAAAVLLERIRVLLPRELPMVHWGDKRGTQECGEIQDSNAWR